jgi:hypothetical protein
MHTLPHPVTERPRSVTHSIPKATLRAERAYQGLTIAFVLLLLASLWLFR